MEEAWCGWPESSWEFRDSVMTYYSLLPPEMLDTFQKFAAKYYLQLSTYSKHASLSGAGKTPDRSLMLDGKQLPWVESGVHLGHILHQSGNKDTRVERASFIDESVEGTEAFQFPNPI